MATAKAVISKTTSPAGFFYTFDRTDVNDGSTDNMATAANAAAAIDAIKALAGGMPGVISNINITINTFE
jgi:hypothetical protein